MAQRLIALRIISLEIISTSPHLSSPLTERISRFTESVWPGAARRSYVGEEEQEEARMQGRISNRATIKVGLSKAKILLLLAWVVVVAVGATAEIWTVLAVDPKGDGRDSSLADAAQLSYRYDKQQDLLWFRVSLYDKPNEESFGVNIVLDTGADDAAKMNWWGANKDFKF